MIIAATFKCIKCKCIAHEYVGDPGGIYVSPPKNRKKAEVVLNCKHVFRLKKRINQA